MKETTSRRVHFTLANSVLPESVARALLQYIYTGEADLSLEVGIHTPALD